MYISSYIIKRCRILPISSKMSYMIVYYHIFSYLIEYNPIEFYGIPYIYICTTNIRQNESPRWFT